MAQVGNWTEERSLTQGVGDITLGGAISLDKVAFKDSVSAGEVWCSVKNGNNQEAGIYIFDGVDQLQRSQIMATYENGVYDFTSPTPIDLKGASIVSCTFNAAAFDFFDTGKANVSHQHIESDITDLDKYTQAEVNAAFLRLTGGTLSNGIDIISGLDAIINLESTGGAAQLAGLQLRDATGVVRFSVGRFNTGVITLSRYNSSGVLETDLSFNADGNLASSTVSPTNDTDFTNKIFTESLHRIQTRTVNTDTTLVLTDELNSVQYNSAGAGTITVPPNSSTAFKVGSQILVRTIGTGQVTLVAGAGVTLEAESGFLATANQFGVLTLYQVSIDTWAIMGGKA